MTTRFNMQLTSKQNIINFNFWLKFFQARTNYNNSSTGQLSAVTCFMLFFGSLARIFTSMQETGDTSMIIMYICSTTANAVIAGQLIYYWNAGDKKSKKKAKSSKKQS